MLLGISDFLATFAQNMKKILSGSALKMIAVVTMTIDHLALFMLRHQAEFTAPLFVFHNKAINWYVIMRCIGRLAFPLFAFLIVEGFLHTSNRRRYGYSLLICALVSEIPWALLHHGFHLTGHNVLFTLLLGFLGLCVIERYQDDRIRQGVLLLTMFVFAILFHADYGGAGFAFIVLLYILRQQPVMQAVIGSCMLPLMWVAGLAFIPINMYDGSRGFIRGQLAKYLVYVYYPLHLLVIYLAVSCV